MHEAETRALKRAVTLLVLVSSIRWGWSGHGPPVQEGGETVLPQLLSESKEAADEASRRSRPLGEGELVDPNVADEVDLDRLPGIGPSTARAIMAAREDGLTFRRAEDLLEVRGVGPSTLERIRGSLDLSTTPSSRPSVATRRRARDPAEAGPVDLNRAGPEELQRLPGIGPALAERIVAFRSKQVFTSVDDIVRVRGIGPATVARLRPLVTVGRGH